MGCISARAAGERSRFFRLQILECRGQSKLDIHQSLWFIRGKREESHIEGIGGYSWTKRGTRCIGGDCNIKRYPGE